MEPLAPDTYAQFLADLKRRIQAAQLRAALAVNRETGAAVLADRPRYPRSAGTGKLGREGHRSPCRGPQARVSRYEGFLAAQPQVYETVRRSLGRGAICAAGCCTIAVVPQLRPARQGYRPRRASLVRAGRHPARLEPSHSGPPDRERSPSTTGESDHQLRSRPPAASVRSCARSHQGSHTTSIF